MTPQQDARLVATEAGAAQPNHTDQEDHTVTTPTLVPPPGAADMEDTHYGIAVCHLGEDGQWLMAIGHHEPRRFVAACNRHLRTFVGLLNLADDLSAEAAPWLAQVRQEWAIFRAPDPVRDEDPDCEWIADWSGDKSTPGAVPVTLLELTP